MKGKFSTKTILISILTVILLAVAITGTVLFLKDSGKASAAQEDKKAQESQEVTLPVTGTDKQNEETTSPTVEENNEKINQEANQERINENTQNNNTQTNSNIQTGRRTSENNSANRVQGEQEFFTYRDKLVSEDFLVGWTPISVKTLIQTNENELNVPELEINKKSYTEADIIYKDEGIAFPEETIYTYTRPGEKIFYEINVANISKIDAKNIRVYDTIPEGTTLFQKPENAEFENEKLTWTINIPAETEITLRFIVTVNKEKTSGTIRNFAIVNGDKTNETENPVIVYKKSVKQTEPLHEEETIDYTISITNTGEVDTIIKQVEDTIPDGITYKPNSASHSGNYNEEDRKITWYDIPLLRNETVEITFKATVDKLPAGIYGKTIENIAIVDGDNTNEVINHVVKPHITRVKTNNPVEAEYLHEGDTITYTITAGNDGTEAKTIKIEDEAPEGTTLKEIKTAGGNKVGEKGVVWENITLNPGESKTFEFTVTVNNLPEKEYGTTIKNTAKVDGEDTNEVINHVVKPHITRLKTNNPVETENLHEGDTITYTITAGNDGTEAKTIKIEDEAPEGTTLKEIKTAGGNKVGEKGVVWENITLNPGESKTFEFTVTVNNLPEKEYGTTIKNTAKVDGEDTNEVINHVIKPHITRSKIAWPLFGKLHEDDEITYMIFAGNNGTETKVIDISDEIPDGTTYVQNTADNGGTYIAGKNEKVVWKNVILAPDDVKMFTFKVKINKLPEGVYSKTIENIAIVDGENTNEVDHDVIKPHITRLKANNPVETENLHEGDTITYTITAGNDGTEAKTIKIEDEAPEGTTLKEIKTAGGNKVGEKGVVWENITLNPGESKTFEFTVTVNNLPEKEYGTTIKNTAKVDGEDTNEVINHVVKPHITAEKVSNPKTGSTVKYGDIITYTIKVKNDGTETKTVDITDNIPLNTEFDSVQDEGITITNNGKVTGVKWTKTIPANTTTPITVSFKVKVTGNVAQKIENTAIVDNEETNKTEHEIMKDIKITTKSYTGKNVILVLDLSSSMLDKTSNGKTRLEVLKKEANKFIDNILVNTNNTITLITFNYDSYDNAIKNSQELDRRYKTTYEANLRSLNRAFVGTTVQKRNSNNAIDLKNIINSISLKRALLTNIQVAMRTTLEEVNKLSKDSSRETVVVFIGDGAPSCTSYEDTSKPGDNGTYYGFDTQTNTEKAINNYANKIKTKAKIYTVGFELQGEDAWKQEISNRIIAKMSNDNGTESNNYHFLATANDLSKKLSQIGEALGETKTINLTTNNVGEVNEKLPKNTKLKIDEKRPVILNIDSEQRSFKTINEIQDYFNSTGRLKYDTTKTEFIIYATKFNPESKISLSYYYTK